MNLLSVRREVGEFKKRYKWMVLFVLIAMTTIIGRLFQLQILQNDRWLAEAERNITKVVRLPATRGILRSLLSLVREDGVSHLRQIDWAKFRKGGAS